jgi:hypothetical protein
LRRIRCPKDISPFAPTWSSYAATPASIKLADAQHALARSYGVASWPRLKVACELMEAIWQGDLETVRRLVTERPELLIQQANGLERSNWGNPLSYAANVGDNAIVEMLLEKDGDALQYAFERACLRGKLPTAKLLYERGARPQPGSVMGPCETLSAIGLGFQLELGAELIDEQGDPLAPIGLLLETYSRNPDGKHGCMELMARHGITWPDNPVFAVHRGRLDLLQEHVRRDPGVLNRHYFYDDIYPLALGCHEDRTLALGGAPIDGGTLLHLCVDFDEYALVEWLLQNGADPNTPAAIDPSGFGGHTALYGCVVSQPYRCSRDNVAMTKLLLAHGADPTVRASLRKALRFVDDETLHTWHEVTPLEWGRQFHDQDWVNPAVLTLLS